MRCHPGGLGESLRSRYLVITPPGGLGEPHAARGSRTSARRRQDARPSPPAGWLQPWVVCTRLQPWVLCTGLQPWVHAVAAPCASRAVQGCALIELERRRFTSPGYLVTIPTRCALVELKRRRGDYWLATATAPGGAPSGGDGVVGGGWGEGYEGGGGWGSLGGAVAESPDGYLRPCVGVQLAPEVQGPAARTEVRTGRSSLQPRGTEAAAPWGRGCDPVCRRLQPHVFAGGHRHGGGARPRWAHSRRQGAGALLCLLALLALLACLLLLASLRACVRASCACFFACPACQL